LPPHNLAAAISLGLSATGPAANRGAPQRVAREHPRQVTTLAEVLEDDVATAKGQLFTQVPHRRRTTHTSHRMPHRDRHRESESSS